jgi:GR25 family glycosyltransferase involved in LPS biosynthesis
MNHPYLQNTLFINLNHRVDRLDHVKHELNKLGIGETAERFPAIRLAHGNVGCTMSHIKCLELAKERKYPYVFICEDDIQFTNPALFLENLQKLHDSSIYWDVLVVGGNNAPPFDPVNDFCVRVYNIQTTTGYIVKESYYDTLLTNYKEGIQKLLREPEKKKQYSIDIYWKSLQSTDIWLVLIPLTVIQYCDYSDIECCQVNYSNAMLDLDKKEMMAYFMKKQQEEQRMRQLFSMNL